MASAKIRLTPYNDFLQPALQRRFVLTLSIVLLVAYVEAVWLGTWDSFIGTILPIFRTSLFFLCVFPLVLLRIAFYHVDMTPTTSSYELLTRAVTSKRAWTTVVVYAIFSWLFGLVLVLYKTREWGFPHVSYSHHTGDRAKLNEKCIFFATYFCTLGIVHGIKYVLADYDLLQLGISHADANKKKAANRDPSILATVRTRLPRAATQALGTAALALLIHILAYALVLRPFAWSWTLGFMRLFYNLPKSNLLPSIYPIHFSLLVYTFYAGFLYSFLLFISNLSFTALMAAEPLKNGKPLTSESKDPNGSLLNGLRNKKTSIQSFAAWELAFIACDFSDRRQAIFEDIDRKDGPMWTQLYQLGIAHLQQINANITAVAAPPPPPAPPAAQRTAASQLAQQGPSTPTRRVGTHSPRSDNVEVPSPEPSSLSAEIKKKVSSVARDPNKTPLSEVSAWLSPKTAKLADHISNRYLTPDQRARLQPSQVQTQVSSTIKNILLSPMGWPLRTCYSTRLALSVFGGAGCDAAPSLYVNSVRSLAQLAVHSIKEDKFGNVQRNVGELIRTFNALTRQVEGFATGFEKHWLDYQDTNSSGTGSKHVDELLDALKEGLCDMLGVFEQYSGQLGLGPADIRAAREAAGMPEQMIEVGR